LCSEGSGNLDIEEGAEMIWYVLEVEDAVHSDLLRGRQFRLLVHELVNGKWEVKQEERETMDIINAAATKYPNSRSRFTSRYFTNFRAPLLSTLERVALRAVGRPAASTLDIHVDVVAEIII
jgi:hypothetical protein